MTGSNAIAPLITDVTVAEIYFADHGRSVAARADISIAQLPRTLRVVDRFNIDGVPARDAYSVGHGWVVLVHPRQAGTHQIILRVVGTDVFGNTVDLTNPTTIIVKRGR